ncbi:MAG: FAD-binding oxidoreductase [Armatimonadetes bacterium CG2_30_66_41]|nr:FAD-binding protein [Armatimonadota bacterium]NCO94297.1 FAD-binding protein [Armatimonadota bacterium]NCP32048.1 FAD-binding protein [Armatimonadota bacterium]NDK14825.1 FAD-binding protein [Armatimonadota bacterium]OIP12643.1 MAG: FAD-binding oxidoreductase [Armatimonadetes bacterium CG2_30_66_41]
MPDYDIGKLAQSLRAICGPAGVIADPTDLLTYECDAYIVERVTPDLVVMPATTDEAAQVMALLHREGVPVTPRGTGTSLAGGCLAASGGVVVTTTRLKRIREIDLRNRYAVLDAGVINADLHRAVNPHGYHYAPDPSSEQSCTIGGTVATNAGGPHTLKWGVTTNHVLGLEVVLPEGTVLNVGGPTPNLSGYDLTGVLVGSEGTLGLVTGVTVRLVRLADAVRTMLAIFDRLEDATDTVTDIIGTGIVPAALELMDQTMLGAVESGLKVGFPTDAEAVLIIELDGLEPGLDEELEAVTGVCERHGVREVQRANTEAERAALWKGRKRSFGCIGKLSRSFVCEDGVVPRPKLSQAIREIGKLASQHKMRVAIISHAGDGSLHPILLYDERDRAQVETMKCCSEAIMRKCLELGGTSSGEHGIGWEKAKYLPVQYSVDDLDSMRQIRGVFNPTGRCNPHKILGSDVPLVESLRGEAA